MHNIFKPKSQILRKAIPGAKEIPLSSATELLSEDFVGVPRKKANDVDKD